MSLSADLKTINCTSCGAGLDLLGGGRVRAHICGYCGAELDAQDNYKILAKFDNLERPYSPFSIGMTGRIKGADYTVIGTLEHRETDGGRSWTWVDHQLYSPTHGYAWLSFEDGHYIFTRRYRRSVWISVAEVESAEAPPRASADGQGFIYYETSTSAVTFAEGEFTWAPKLGDETTTISALGKDAMLSFSERGEEREVYRSTHLDPATLGAAFGLSLPTASTNHPLRPDPTARNRLFTALAAVIFALLSLGLSSLFDGNTGPQLGRVQVLNAAQLPAPITLNVQPDRGVHSVFIRASSSSQSPALGQQVNRWSRLSAQLAAPNGTVVNDIPPDAGVYVGFVNSPSTSLNESRLYFRPTQAGPYTLTFELTDQGVSTYQPNGISTPAPQFTDLPPGEIIITLHAGATNALWLKRLTILFGLITIAAMALHIYKHRQRWSGGDWHED